MEWLVETGLYGCYVLLCTWIQGWQQKHNLVLLNGPVVSYLLLDWTTDGMVQLSPTDMELSIIRPPTVSPLSPFFHHQSLFGAARKFTRHSVAFSPHCGLRGPRPSFPSYLAARSTAPSMVRARLWLGMDFLYGKIDVLMCILSISAVKIEFFWLGKAIMSL